MKKFITGSVLAAVVYFIVSNAAWMAFYGSIFTTHAMNGLLKSDAEVNYLLLVLSNLSYGCLLSYVMTPISGLTLRKGFLTGTVIGLLFFTSFDLTFYAASHMFKGYKIVLLDIVLYALFTGIAGAVMGAYLGRSKAA